jgi:transposase
VHHDDAEEGDVDAVIIGVDPHKASATIEVRDQREVLLATGRFGTDSGG